MLVTCCYLGWLTVTLIWKFNDNFGESLREDPGKVVDDFKSKYKYFCYKDEWISQFGLNMNPKETCDVL